MILPEMNKGEVLKEIVKDKSIVNSKANHLAKKLRRKVIKSKKKFVRKIYEYRSKNRNKYLIHLEVSKKRCDITLCCYYVDAYGLNAVIEDENTFFHYSPHFLRRYNERLLKHEEYSKLDTLKYLILRNCKLVGHTHDNHEIVVKMNDGYGLGYSTWVKGRPIQIRHLRTFISNGMVMDHQKLEFNFLEHMLMEYQEELGTPNYNQNICA